MSECTSVRVQSDENVCLAVVDAVSELTSTDPLELEPLGTVVDTDAIDTLFGSAGVGEGVRHDTFLSFRYERCDVTVESDGTVSATYAPATTEFGVEHPATPVADVGAAAGDSRDADDR